MKKLVIIDTNFVWPPDGGAPVDLHSIASRYAQIYETTLIIPRLNSIGSYIQRPWPLNRTKFFIRGEVNFVDTPPYQIETQDWSLFDFIPSKVAKKIRQRVDQISPDFVFVADGWYFKPRILLELASYKPLLRLYAHEMMCLKGNGMMYKNNRVCDVNFLDRNKSAYKTCRNCALQFYSTYPSPRWIYEAFTAKAFSNKYVEQCILAFNSSSKVLVGNSWIANRLSPFISAPVKAVPHGVEIERYNKEVTESESILKRIIVLGRLDMKIKGVQVVIDACQALWQKGYRFELCVSQNKKLPNLPFLKPLPWVRHEQVQEYYKSAFLAVVPSLWPDPFPIVTLEAMASGLPVVGSRVGGIPEQIVDGVTGYLFSPGSVSELVEKIEWLFNHQEEAREMGKKGKSRVLNQFSWDYIFDQNYRSIFE